MTNEKRLRVSFLVVLYNLILKAQKLKNLAKHVGLDTASLAQALWHLSGSLLCVNLDVFGSVSELIQLREDLSCLSFELSLQNFKSLLVIQLLLDDHSWLRPEHVLNLGEEGLGWPRAILEVSLDALL